MQRPNRTIAIAAVVVAAVGGPATVAAQDANGDEALVYEREVFHYDAYGRVDPFKSLLAQGDLWIRAEDLSLRGVVLHEEPARSVAVLVETESDRRIQARVGERIGTLRVLAIHADRVEIVIEELGVARREVLWMERPETPAVEESA